MRVLRVAEEGWFVRRASGSGGALSAFYGAFDQDEGGFVACEVYGGAGADGQGRHRVGVAEVEAGCDGEVGPVGCGEEYLL